MGPFATTTWLGSPLLGSLMFEFLIWTMIEYFLREIGSNLTKAILFLTADINLGRGSSPASVFTAKKENNVLQWSQGSFTLLCAHYCSPLSFSMRGESGSWSSIGLSGRGESGSVSMCLRVGLSGREPLCSSSGWWCFRIGLSGGEISSDLDRTKKNDGKSKYHSNKSFDLWL